MKAIVVGAEFVVASISYHLAYLGAEMPFDGLPFIDGAADRSTGCERDYGGICRPCWIKSALFARFKSP